MSSPTSLAQKYNVEIHQLTYFLLRNLNSNFEIRKIQPTQTAISPKLMLIIDTVDC